MTFYNIVVFLTLLILTSERIAFAQPLTETYKKQEELRSRIEATCIKQFMQAQYHPVEVEQELPELSFRYMISKKGVQAIRPEVVPQSGGGYKCWRGVKHERPMIVGREYQYSERGNASLDDFIKPYRAKMFRAKEKLELEPCSIDEHSTTCLVQYKQLGSSQVNRKILGFKI